MTSRERLLAVLAGQIPDRVPVCPDTSNMIPAKLTGRPFWDIYLYNDPPLWKAYIDCVKHFGFDSLMDGLIGIQFADLPIDENCVPREVAIVKRTDDRIITQEYSLDDGKKRWASVVNVFYRDNPPTYGIGPEKIGLPAIPTYFEPLEPRTKWPKGEELLKLAKEEMGDHGLIGIQCGTTKLVNNEEEIYDFFDNPKKYYLKSERLLEYYKKKFFRLMDLECRPDFLCLGASGTLIHQTLDTFRELALPIVQEISRLAKSYGIPTHVHSCGPEKALVKVLAEETDLTVIDPLEIPPMGDCNLRELKRLYGQKIVLKGNLHTTNIMLEGSVMDVREACRQAIDDAACGGRFILSTGDQCGRDTKEENILAMIEAACEYGRY